MRKFRMRCHVRKAMAGGHALLVLLCSVGGVAAASASSGAIGPQPTTRGHSAASLGRANGADGLWAPEPWPTETLELMDPVEVIDRPADVARLKRLVAEEKQPSKQSAGPYAAVPGRAAGQLLGPLIDPEELLLEDETTTWPGLAPRASPSPVPSGGRKIAKPEVLLTSDRGVLLSVPLSPAEQAKAAHEIVKALCDNTCATSYDGICSDGAASTASCSGEEAFPAAGRGSCKVAEGNECELGTDCTPAAHPHSGATRPLPLTKSPRRGAAYRFGLRRAPGFPGPVQQRRDPRAERQAGQDIEEHFFGEGARSGPHKLGHVE